MFRRLAFGEQGLASSRDCAFHVCTICKAKVRMSYWVVIFFVYSLVKLLQREVHNPRVSGEVILWEVFRAVGYEAILLATVLCHEFGHGNTARWLGGEIDHVLLWVFGGICFSSTPRVTDNWKLLRNDLLVVAAGPCTHFLQTPAWGVCLLALFYQFQHTGYHTVWDALWAAAHPLRAFDISTVRNEMGLWPALPWALVADALDLNILLFLFNVFVPMYPADGSKLLVLVLMFCFGVTPRCAAIVLLVVSVPCAVFFIAYALFAGGGLHLRHGLMLWMGVMSLCEAHKIITLLNAKRLYEHPLFQTARSWRREERDRFGRLARINTSDADDDEPLSGGHVCCIRDVCMTLCSKPSQDDTEEGRSLCCCCPCLGRSTDAGAQLLADANKAEYGSNEVSAVRADRSKFLSKMEQQNMDRQKTVRDVMDERCASAQERR
mmetsp:Transcript_21978/g.61472  ORF Transcript_21978/g.61472 Transcript_21978/m.61472 type:complete len:436 (-) Transcript_21978:115-1422(-)